MTLFENAQEFFHNCESLGGWEKCRNLVAENATFTGQCEPLIAVKTVEDYVGWMVGFGTIAPGCSYQLHAASFDEKNSIALFFATFKATHTGDGGPVAPTNKTTNAEYVYALKMNEDGKVIRMTKIWNASWTLRELGWME